MTRMGLGVSPTSSAVMQRIGGITVAASTKRITSNGDIRVTSNGDTRVRA